MPLIFTSPRCVKCAVSAFVEWDQEAVKRPTTHKDTRTEQDPERRDDKQGKRTGDKGDGQLQRGLPVMLHGSTLIASVILGRSGTHAEH